MRCVICGGVRGSEVSTRAVTASRSRAGPFEPLSGAGVFSKIASTSVSDWALTFIPSAPIISRQGTRQRDLGIDLKFTGYIPLFYKALCIWPVDVYGIVNSKSYPLFQRHVSQQYPACYT